MSTRYRAGLPTWRDARPVFFRFFIMLGDVAAVLVSYSLAFAIRFQFPFFIRLFPITKGVPTFDLYSAAAPLVIFMWILALSWQGTYSMMTLTALDEAIRTLRACFWGTVLAMSAMFLYRESSFSRIVFVLGGFFSFLTIYLWRQGLKNAYVAYIKSRGRPRRVLVVGEGYLANSLVRILRRHGDRAVLRHSKLSVDTLIRTIGRSRIGEVLLAHPNLSHKDIVHVASYCEEEGVSCRLVPDILEIRMGEVLVDASLGVPTIQLKSVMLQGSAFLMKRFMDVAFSCLVLGVLSPFLLIVALLIKVTSPGPIFFMHKRSGFRGREFYCYKFRTMVADADKEFSRLQAESERGDKAFKIKNDARITPIGKFLRRLSIDEIPQLINVLKGEMSLIGPRPQSVLEASKYNEWEKKRLNVLPGITGLWQVSGRADLTFSEMVDLDIFYIEHWSPGLDLKILVKTLPAVIFAKGAY